METYNKTSKYPVLNEEFLKSGYIVAVKRLGKSFFHNQIEKIQSKKGYSREASKYVHIAVIGKNQYIVDVSPPKTKIVSLFEKYPDRYIKILKYKGYEEDEGDIKGHNVAFWAASTCNISYDWIGVIAFKFSWLGKIFRKLQEKWLFCSECAIWALQKEFPAIGAIFDFVSPLIQKSKKKFFGDINISPEKCMPAYFLDNEDFSIIWEGEV